MTDSNNYFTLEAMVLSIRTGGDANHKFLRSVTTKHESNLAMTLRTKTQMLDIPYPKAALNKFSGFILGPTVLAQSFYFFNHYSRKEALAGFADEVIYSSLPNNQEDWTEDSVGKPLYSRFIKTNDFKGVPHPLSGDYTPTPQEEIDESLYVYGKKGPQEPEPSVSDDRSNEYSTCQSNDSAGSIGTSTEHSVDPESEISRVPQEVYVSTPITTNEKGVSTPKSKEVEPSCVSHIKTPSQPIKDQETPKANRKNWNAMMERELGEGYSFTKKKCFVCGSLSHLIKDCDYYEKKMAREAEVKKQRVFNTGNMVAKPVWTNTDRINHANQFVPRSVQLNTGRTNINSVRPNINTGRTNINSVRPRVNTVNSNVNTVRSRQPVPTRTSNSFGPKRSQGNWGSAVKTSAGTSEVTNNAGTSQTPNANASEEKDEDAELIVVSSAVKIIVEKVKTRKSSTNSKKEEILSEPQQENEASSTDTSEDNPKIIAFRGELEEIAQKHLGTVPDNNSTNTLSVNSGSEPVNTSELDPDDTPMPELEIFHNFSKSAGQEALSVTQSQPSSSVVPPTPPTTQPIPSEATTIPPLSQPAPPTPIAETTLASPSPSPSPAHEPMEHTFEQPSSDQQPPTPRQEATISQLMTRIDDLEKQLKETKQTFGKAILTLVERVKTLEVALKRKTKRVLLSDSEEEETEAQGRKTHDLDPLVSLVQELVTPSKTVNASGEEQVEDISPTTLEAAAILTKVHTRTSESVDQRKDDTIEGRVHKRICCTGLDFKEVNTTDSNKISVPSPDNVKRRITLIMTEEEETQASRKTKEQIPIQEEQDLAEAIIFNCFRKIFGKGRSGQTHLKLNLDTEKIWDTIKAKLEANARIARRVSLEKDLTVEDYQK
ncbi:hypothetical protein Tco_0652459 [Tanacetum coccineum]|uniref:CCHC-type domain-containing protein n=1 Tax=Tanacetum coccineum TaxID=301880 RepID=A0ABQ4WXV4_9ASTR